MDADPTSAAISRRVFLKAGGVAAAALGGAAALANAPWNIAGQLAGAAPLVVKKQLAASDGFMWLPGINQIAGTGIPGWSGFGPQSNGLYIFGFKDETTPAGGYKTFTQAVNDAKGRIQTSAPVLAVDESTELQLRLANVSFQLRPDLADAHTIHWHGFRQAIPLFDGVPEVSVAVPQGRTFTYDYRPRDAGTYMYHCHFEDVEHVQMGMQGTLYVRPKQNLAGPIGGFSKFAYNDGDGSTGYHREFSLILNDLWTVPHINSLHIQESVWSDYDANYWTINGRSYPDTIKPSGSMFPALPAGHPLKNSQPISSLIQVNPGNRVLLRFVNLGYEQQAMQLQGIAMKVVGEDASFLRGPGGADESYETDTIYIGSGESRDVLFTAPAYSGAAGENDPTILNGNSFNRYLLMNRSLERLNNNGTQVNGLGGQVTEVRVYQGGLPAQGLGDLNKTYV